MSTLNIDEIEEAIDSTTGEPEQWYRGAKDAIALLRKTGSARVGGERLAKAAERSANALAVIDEVRGMLAHCMTVEAYRGDDKRFYQKMRCHFLGIQLAVIKFEHPTFSDDDALAFIGGTEFNAMLNEHIAFDDCYDLLTLRNVATAAHEWLQAESRGIQDMNISERDAIAKLIGALGKAAYDVAPIDRKYAAPREHTP